MLWFSLYIDLYWNNTHEFAYIKAIIKNNNVKLNCNIASFWKKNVNKHSLNDPEKYIRTPSASLWVLSCSRDGCGSLILNWHYGHPSSGHKRQLSPPAAASYHLLQWQPRAVASLVCHEELAPANPSWWFL